MGCPILDRMDKNVDRFGQIATAVLFFTCLCGCQRERTKESDAPAEFQRQGGLILIGEQSPLRTRLVFDSARAETVQSQLAAPAVVEADPQRFANIFSPLSGRLIKLHVQLGDAVTNGQLLASLSSPDFLAAQNDYVKAKSAVLLTSKSLRRQQALLENKVAAEKDVEQAVSDAEAAKSDLASATGRLVVFGFDPETGPLGQALGVVSPISGQVVEMASAHGQFRNDVTAALMTVADLSTVWITASVPEKDLRFLAKGQRINASLAAFPGETFTGEVLFIGGLVDPDLRVAKVRIAFSNPKGRLKPGMFATVNFLGFPEARITIPTTAIVQVGAAAFVFEQVKPWTLKAREVSLGAQQGERTIVTAGLEAGASILTKEGVLFQ